MLTSIILALLWFRAIHTHSTSYPSRAVTNFSKAGLAWPNGLNVDISQFESTQKVSWYYTWSPYSFDTDLEFVPMLWGQEQIPTFTAMIDETITHRNVTAVLGMNEPQEMGQSYLTPDQGAQIWKAYLEPLRTKGLRLGSPAPSGAPSGIIWLQNFLLSCAGGCTVDFIALHWYDVNATAFQAYLELFYVTFQRPLWITEWACQNYNNASAQCSESDIVWFLNQTQGFMDNSPFVERYAWFGAMKNLQGVNPANALMDGSGKINDLGKQYIGLDGARGSVNVTSGDSSTQPMIFAAVVTIVGTLVELLIIE